MSIWWILGIGIPVIIGAIIDIVLRVEKENRDKKYQARTESLFKELNKKFDMRLYQDGIPFLKEKEKQAIYDRALAAIKASDYEAAISVLSDYLNRYPIFDSEKCAVLNLIGISLSEGGKPDESLLLFNEMFFIAARSGDIAGQVIAQNNLGVSFFRVKHYEEALCAYDKAIELKQDYPEVWSNKGNALDNLGQHEEALHAFDKAIELKHDYPAAWYSKGLILGKLGRYEESLRASEKAIELIPDDPEAWSNKGNSLDGLGRREEALYAYDKAIKMKPDYPMAWYNKGCVLGKLGRYEEALRALKKAIELKPDFPEAWNVKGFILLNQHIYYDTTRAFEEAIKLKSDHSGAWFNFACCYSRQQNKPETLKKLAKAIELDPKLKDKAETNKSLEWLWNDPDFKKLVE